MKSDDLTAQGPGSLFLDWDRLDVPAWVVGPDAKIHYLNAKAEELLGVSLRESVGKPCNEVITGKGVCDPAVCPLLVKARNNGVPEPMTIQVGGGGHGSSRWVQIIPMVLTAPDGTGPYLVEIATDVERWLRIEDYVKKIASRELESVQAPKQQLTSREAEILSLLADDLSQHAVATRLYVSYTTVRTHVQHVLAKLGVHSIQAAVAQHLLQRSADDE